MRLSCKFLKNVADVNNFQYADQWDIAEGSAQELYFQVIDKNKEDLRYISQAGSFDIDVTFLDIDTDAEIVITATKPFADDKSIFKVDLTVDQVPNSGAVKFALTEDGVTKTFKVDQAIVVEMLQNGGC